MEEEQHNWKADVEIEPDALDVEWTKQAKLFGHYSKVLAEAQAEVDRVKNASKIKAAKLELAIRKDPASYGLEKVSESAVAAAILLETEYQDLLDQLRQAEYTRNVLDGAVTALNHKKAALENLVRLQGQNYFAGPSTPREIGKEWARDVERRAARDQVKAAGQKARRIAR